MLRHRASMITVYHSAYCQTRRTRDPYGTLPRISEAFGTINQAVVSLSLPVPDLEALFSLRRVPVGSISVAAGAISSGQPTSSDSTVLVPNAILLMVRLVSTSTFDREFSTLTRFADRPAG